MMTKDQLIQKAVYAAMDPGETPKHSERFALIEALLRDALGQDHGVWRWRARGAQQ